MPQKKFLIPLILLQIIPIIIFPLKTIASGISIFGFVALVFVLLGYGLWQGRSWALSMSIFIQGFNIITRLMMVLPHALRVDGSGWDLPYLLMAVISMAISGWFMLRLDKPDIRSLVTE
jgi:hypothetical protein